MRGELTDGGGRMEDGKHRPGEFKLPPALHLRNTLKVESRQQ